MKLTDMRRTLEERGIQLTKSLGQNFLHDGNQLARIASLAELNKDDKVLEIGPGLGPLTELLLAQAGEVLAVEVDARLVAVLKERFLNSSQSNPKLALVHEDGLKLVRERGNWRGWKLVSNLPYSVASPILVELALCSEPPERLVATLQAEVARRLMAKADEDDYGVLTLLVQLKYEPQQSFRIPATCFFPEPEVASACVCLTRRSDELLATNEQRLFVQIVKASFSQRRKMMFKLLKARWPAERLEAVFESVGIPRDARAETIDVHRFVRLTKELKNHG